MRLFQTGGAAELRARIGAHRCIWPEVRDLELRIEQMLGSKEIQLS